jgi:hypothetical protein
MTHDTRPHDHTIPHTWDDLDQRQLLICYQIVMDLRINRIFEGPEQIALRRMELTKALLELSDDFLKQWEADAGEDFFDEFDQVIQTVSAFAFEPAGDDKYQIALTRYTCPYPQLEHPGGPLYAPADELENITIYELGMSFKAFETFAQTGDLEAMHRLLAILYRPGKLMTEENILSDYQGDRRLPLYNHETTIPRRMEHMAKLPALVSQVIVFWFACCRQRIVNSFPNIFKAPEGEQQGNDYSWAGVILNLADGVVHEETVSNKNYGTALVYLSMLEDRRKEQEMKQKLAYRKR